MGVSSTTHLVLLPAYNAGPRLREVVAEALRHWQPVLVVDDGSDDGSEQVLRELAQHEPALTVLTLPRNRGKGAAVLAGALTAQRRGFTHALVMDADGQHPAGSIAEFMAASLRHPTALVLGRPVFPANIPAERLHGRKLSVGLVHLELLGRAVADPLFGFRVYPLAPLLAVLGPRRGGRRYDFDTEAAVRLGWAGVPPHNLTAPVRYFSRAEGGVSHFHYLRDNVTLVWMHTRLLSELLFWRWPALLRHRRLWRGTGVALALLLFALPPGHATGGDPLVNPELRIAAASPAWADLVSAFADHADITADFTERRHFPFKQEPVELQGEVRVSSKRGLSLHYTAPTETTIILDEQGLLLRAASGEQARPADPRAAAANEALRHLLRFDLAALARDFELFGQRDAGPAWTLVLVPRTETLRRSVGRITAAGEAATIRRIEIRRSARQAIVITIDMPRPPAAFTADELKRFFR
ncbi:MAG: glycosyltransferase [Lacunisphaera sp.]|nr:glycosyltransferase [Lacunisphaera sp.]